jgi:hypothetical protein
VRPKENKRKKIEKTPEGSIKKRKIDKDSGVEPPGVEHVFIHEKCCTSPDQTLQTIKGHKC